MSEELGCLYDGTARVERLSDDEAAQLDSDLPAPQAEGAGDEATPRFEVITTIRSATFSRNRRMTAPFGIVLHHTGGRFASDMPTLTRPGTGVSANDFIDKRGRIFELCELPKRAHHAGKCDLHGITDWNTHGWGIEIENLGKGGDPYPQVQIDAIVWRCRERRRRLGITDPKMLVRHRDVCVPRTRKGDTSDNFPFEEVRRRIFAKTDPTDAGLRGELRMEKYNIAGLNVKTGLIATAFAGALQAERIRAMPLLSGPNVAAAAAASSAAKFRAGPRLVAIGTEAAKAVKDAGQTLGTEDRSDLIGVIGQGAGNARLKDTVKKTEAILVQICRVEQKDPARAKKRFEQALVALAPEFKTLV
jgi:N-acetyl-anhydromuramyl-L-alanine amidase AmpD